MSVPVVDLFAGPGGLGEGFSSLCDDSGQALFRIGLSVEKDPVAHRTLTLRAVFRQLRNTEDAEHYYRYITGEIDEFSFRQYPGIARAFEHAAREARCLELGKCDTEELDMAIQNALQGAKIWVLIGGPPCQAYSLAGRSRRAGDASFYSDEKHFLYREYLRIIQRHQPTVFVMENVKGLLSSRHSGDSMFEKILMDLSRPDENLEYDIRSFVCVGNQEALKHGDYVIHAEEYGIPQKRHRVILLGVKKTLNITNHRLLKQQHATVTVRDAIGDMPKIRSRLSRQDCFSKWWQAVNGITDRLVSCSQEICDGVQNVLNMIFEDDKLSTGGSFVAHRFEESGQSVLQEWLRDSRMEGICQHEARGHMATDLMRYLYSAVFAKINEVSPKLENFPDSLLPAHRNAIDRAKIPFNDRFRVQCEDRPATTVVAHIAKDGHYYIHYDPSQCRSLTVREAARLQTFPDNYFFMGNRTEQYTQVGNAVPPLLARQLAEVVNEIVAAAKTSAGFHYAKTD